MFNDVKAVCKRCTRQVSAAQFVLDAEYKTMICPFCVKEKKITSGFAKPAGSENRLNDPNSLNRAANRTAVIPTKSMISKPEATSALKLASKQSTIKENQHSSTLKLSELQQNNTSNFRRLDQERVKMTCQKCKYEFVYNETQKYPSSCPYCNGPILMFLFQK
ncbi:hypothetical protein HYX12_03315 [Candidatus Woesearchaeota archaeon]|nr:hypothetical protein [Candidatus Woesearchaeota archaeon]